MAKVTTHPLLGRQSQELKDSDVAFGKETGGARGGRESSPGNFFPFVHPFNTAFYCHHRLHLTQISATSSTFYTLYNLSLLSFTCLGTFLCMAFPNFIHPPCIPFHVFITVVPTTCSTASGILSLNTVECLSMDGDLHLPRCSFPSHL